MYENRNYVIFDVAELDRINFDEVLETSQDTVRRSVDGTRTFVKWDNDVPASVALLTTKSRYLTHEEFLVILESAEWQSPNNL